MKGSQGKWTLALLNVDEQTQLRDALQLTKVPSLFLIHHGLTVQSTPHTELLRDSLSMDLHPLLSSLRLRSGLTTLDQLLVEQINKGYEDAEAGRYESAIKEYTEALGKAGEKYELTCLVALIKAHSWKKDYAYAESYYNRLKDKYGREAIEITEVASACKLVEDAIGMFHKDKADYERYLALKNGILAESPMDIPNIPIRLKLASLDFDFGYYTPAFDTVLQVIEEEATLNAYGYATFREMCDFLGPENGYVKLARTRLEHLRIRLHF